MDQYGVDVQSNLRKEELHAKVILWLNRVYKFEFPNELTDAFSEGEKH